MGSKVPSGQWLSQGPFPAPLLVGPSQEDFSFFQFDVIDNIMCLDDVLGFINPESQMPNTVLLSRVWGGVSEGGGLSLGRTRNEVLSCRDESGLHEIM